MSTTTASGGCSEPPDLHPPDPTDSVTIVCPACDGSGTKIVARVCGPTTSSPCVTCTEGRIQVYWASARDEPDSSRRTHLVQVDTAPAEPLCDHDPIPTADLVGGFYGPPCKDCLDMINRWDIAEHKLARSADDFDGGTGEGDNDQL